ncbi:hypothetical protein HJG60_008201 [Phyllostomus discolor]|uniref:Uncharacterized protein n=1 Tax=Phyllostomus discolor TaxID=89673 RepID=A0A834DQF8_9CHIR|nr:hypothetical protein HJG60_008201 [Phyllostomus discolor]
MKKRWEESELSSFHSTSSQASPPHQLALLLPPPRAHPPLVCFKASPSTEKTRPFVGRGLGIVTPKIRWKWPRKPREGNRVAGSGATKLLYLQDPRMGTGPGRRKSWAKVSLKEHSRNKTMNDPYPRGPYLLVSLLNSPVLFPFEDSRPC